MIQLLNHSIARGGAPFESLNHKIESLNPKIESLNHRLNH
jgi:hypothetical protein